MRLSVILGNQLFPSEYYANVDHAFMCEDRGLCTHFKYHKHKIIFFLASMRNYRDQLQSFGVKVHYSQIEDEVNFFNQLEFLIKEKSISEIQIYEIEDKFFEVEMKNFCQRFKLKLEILKSPMFVVSREQFKEYNESVKRPFMKSFYEGMRNQTGILMQKKGSPVGGKYSFDTENRKKIPKKFDVLQNPISRTSDRNTKQVIEMVEKYFPDHPGESSNFWMHVDRSGALAEMDYFFKEKFEYFGVYEDAIDTRDPFLYHSVLSPYLNIGFITPKEVINRALEQKVSLNSKEGFIRQVIGWREFVRGIYQHYSEEQDEKNFFGHKRKLSDHWYRGSTGIAPLDDAILKTLKFGYCHHIERLMILSNIMLLCEIHPQEVHRWFMEMFVDSSDWVMGPNVYGMAQFSDGGIFATKPYIAGSNYIHKMSHYPKGEWDEVLDGLYWRFIEKKSDFFKSNYRMSMMVKLLEKMDLEKKNRIFKKAENFIQQVTVD